MPGHKEKARRSRRRRPRPAFALALDLGGVKSKTLATVDSRRTGVRQRVSIIVGNGQLDLSLQRWFNDSLHSAG